VIPRDLTGAVVSPWWYHTGGITPSAARRPEPHPHVPLTQIWLRDMNSSPAVSHPFCCSKTQAPRLWFLYWAPPAGQLRRGARGGEAGRVSGGGAALVPPGSLRRRGARLRINEPLTPLLRLATMGLPHKTKLLTPFRPRPEWGYRIKLHNPFVLTKAI
jgi:hypothetical protein